MNIEQMADELIEQRPRRRKPFRKTRQRGYLRTRAGSVRNLSPAEVAALKAVVSASMQGRCSHGDWCWQPGCQRCEPV